MFTHAKARHTFLHPNTSSMDSEEIEEHGRGGYNQLQGTYTGSYSAANRSVSSHALYDGEGEEHCSHPKSNLCHFRQAGQLFLKCLHEETYNVMRLLLDDFKMCLPTSPDGDKDVDEEVEGVSPRRRASLQSGPVADYETARTLCIFKNILHIAVAHQNHDVVEMLLSVGCDPNSRSSCQCRPFRSQYKKSANYHRANSTGACLGFACRCLVESGHHFLDQSPLELAIAFRDVHLLTMLAKHSADIAAVDDKGNSPLLRVVRQSPLCWEAVECLLLLGARIHQRNADSVCPLDLLPEVARFQHFCIEECVRIAAESNQGDCHDCCSPKPAHTIGIGSLLQVWRAGHTALQYQHSHAHSSHATTSPRHSKVLQSIVMPDMPSAGSEKSLIGTPVTSQVNVTSTVQRRSLIPGQLHQKFKNDMNDKTTNSKSAFQTIVVEDVWEALFNMAKNTECIMALEAAVLKSCDQLSKEESDEGQDYPIDKNLGKLLQAIINTSMTNFQTNTMSIKEKKELLIGCLSPLITICQQLLRSGRQKVQYTAILTLNKLVDTGIVLDLFEWPQYEVLSSAFNMQHDVFFGDHSPLTLVAPKLRYNQQNTKDQEQQAKQFYSAEYQNEDHIVESMYSFEGNMSEDSQESEFYMAFKQIEPTTVVTMLHNCVTLLRRTTETAKTKCTPAHRWRQCQHHCAAILCSRMLLFLCHMKEFSRNLNDEQVLKVLINLVDVGLDSQILCFLLQSIALISMQTSCHALLHELQIEDLLIQLLLPADDWFYTNHTTLYGQYVKHHAARILVYLGLGDRVGSRVNLFRFIGSDSVVQLGNCDDDQYICDICGPQASVTLPGHSTYQTLETLLQRIIIEIEDELVAAAEELRRQSTISAASLNIPNCPPQPFIAAVDTNVAKQWYISGCLTSSNVETYLTQLTPFIDPVVLLRLLLHKLCWDVGLIKRTTRKHGSVVSQQNSVVNDNQESRKWSCISDPTSNSYVKAAFGKSASFTINQPASSNSSVQKLPRRQSFAFLKKSNSLRQCLSLSSKKTDVVTGPKGVHKSINRTQSGGYAKLSRSSYSKIAFDGHTTGTNIPKYIQHLFRRRTGSAPKPGTRKRHHHHGHRPRMDTHCSVSSTDSEAIYEFQRKLQNYPISRKPPVHQKSIANQSNSSGESKNSRSRQGSPIAGQHCSGSDRSTAFVVAALVERGDMGMGQMDTNVSGMQDELGADYNNTLSTIDYPYCGTPRMTARGSVIEPAITVPQASAGGKGMLTLPAIEVRRPSTFSQAPSPGHNSPFPDVGSLQPLISPSNDSGKSMPLPSPPFDTPRAGSSFSTRSSGGSIILITSSRGSRGPSVGSTESGPFLFSFRMRRRSATFGSPTATLPTPVPATSSTDSQAPNKSLTAELHILRHLLLVCLKTRERSNVHLIGSMKETGDVLRQILNVSTEASVHQWCAEIINVVASHGVDEEVGNEADEKLNDEYLEDENIKEERAQELIVSGSVPVPREDAAQLASIQICIEENWPENRRKQVIRKHLMKGQFSRAREMANKIMVTPWELDQNLFCTPPRKPAMAKKHRSLFSSELSSSDPTMNQTDSPGLARRSPKSILAACFMESPDGQQLTNDIQEQSLPPNYRGDRKALKLIKEKKRKLFHSRVFESEEGMKSLYVQTCRKLPAWGCRIFQVKELVHGHSFKKNMRLLCMSPQTMCLLDADTKLRTRAAETSHLQQWRVGGGLAKHQVVLEFRATKWNFVVPSRSNLKGISMTLWEVLQNDVNLHQSLRFCRPQLHALIGKECNDNDREMQFSAGMTTLYGLELERLQHIFQFPEEVALQLTSVEYELFYSVQPLDYVRYVSCDLTSIPVANQNPSPLRSLVKRFAEVSSWVTHLIVSQPSQEERRVILGFIVRAIETCCNIGNFNTAVELLTGLKSEKLKPFWLLIKTEEKQQFRRLCEFLLPSGSACPAPEYVDAVKRGLKMKQCRLIPFFGTFLRDLYAIVNDVPSIIVIQHNDNQQRLEFLSDFQGEDHFSSRMGVGGLLNMDKIKLVGIVLENIEAFHRHYRTQKLLSQEMDQLMGELRDTFPKQTNGAPALQLQHPILHQVCFSPKLEKKGEDLSDSDYRPIQHVQGSGHGVSLIPIHPSKIDVDMIQRLQHGMTVIRFDQDATRSASCQLSLDPSCGVMVWKRYPMVNATGMSNSMGSSSSPVPPHGSNSTPRTPAVNVDAAGSEGGFGTSRKSFGNYPAFSAMSVFGGPDICFPGLEEGFVRLTAVKRVEFIESWSFDIESVYKRHCMEEMSVPVMCWKVTYGSCLSDNERLHFLAPQHIAQTWVNGLLAVTALLREQLWQADRRVFWLKTLYLDLYHDLGVVSGTAPLPGGIGPKPVDALHAFGGFVTKWRNQFLSVTPAPGQNPRDTPSTPTKQSVSAGSGSSSVEHNRKSSYGSRKNKDWFQKFWSGTKSGSPSPRERSKDRRPGSAASSRRIVESTLPRSSLDSDNTARSSYTSKSLIPSQHGADDNAAMRPAMDETSEPDNLSLRSGTSFRSRKNTIEGVSDTSTSNSSREYQEKPLTFPEFLQLYKSFLIRMRKDLRQLFGEHSSNICTNTPRRFSGSGAGSMLKSNKEKEKRLSVSVENARPTAQEKSVHTSGGFITNEWLTRNTGCGDLPDKQLKIYNALSVASVQSNAALDTSKTTCITVTALRNFCAQHQLELISEADAIKLIQEHEPDPIMQMKNQLSFEGFSRYLMDQKNFAFVPEDIAINPDELQYPLSYYYIASSHNTYLTGHQLKGESSAELYEQVLLTGCRCVELDCWDGDDGYPVIYHGHTFTSKISFKQVINIVKRSAFVASSLPVILSIENHCSLLQQIKMAQMFRNTFGERLITHFVFDSDFSDTPQLPSPMQLQGKIILKNKKLIAEPERPLSVNKIDDGKVGKPSVSDDEDEEEEYFDEEIDEFGDEEDEPEVAVMDSDSPRFSREGSSEKDQTLKGQRKIRTHADAARQDSLSSEASGPVTRLTESEASPGLEKSKKNTSKSMPSGAGSGKEDTSKRNTKKSTAVGTQQIAQELSDMVVYCQAVKFKAFPTGVDYPGEASSFYGTAASPRNSEAFMRKGSVRDSMTSSTLEVPLMSSKSIRAKSAAYKESTPVLQPKRIITGEGSAGEVDRPSTSSGYQSQSVSIQGQRKQPGLASCYKVASLNETAARKLYRKQGLKLIAYSKEHILRTYPAAMRIDSSNMDPLKFWSFGIQMVALNYQTQDQALALNQALFEQFGNCGFCLKPRVLWDPSHPSYRKFNPLSKEFVGNSAVHLTITIISGQNLCPTISNANPCVEIDILGIPIDSAYREKTKSVARNSLNPIWNQTFNFRVHFLDLAFLKLSVTDTGSGKTYLHRILPLKHMRPGYRHVRLRNAQTNQPLDQATLFVYTRLEEEEYIYVEDGGPCLSNNEETNRQQLMMELCSRTLPMLKRQVYVLGIYGLQADDSAVTVDAQQTTTVRQVIAMALQASMRVNDNNCEDYLLLEERAAGQNVANKRILSNDEMIIDAVASWNGNKVRFVCKRKGNDPSSRAWISSIIKSSGQSARPESERTDSQSRDGSVEPPLSVASQMSDSRSEAEGDATFLVCVHNVSNDQPYAILRAPVNSTAQDVIIQVLLKARRMDRPSDLILVEELTQEHASTSQTSTSPSIVRRLSLFFRQTFGQTKNIQHDKSGDTARKEILERVLRPEERVCSVQNNWKCVGRLVLHTSDYATHLEKASKTRRKSGSPRFPRMPKFGRS